MAFPILFCWVLIFLVVVAYKQRKASRKQEKAEKSFWERENQANAVRKQDISNLDYVNLSGASLPFALFEDEALKECENQVRKLAGEKILNLTGISNTDLKMAYGAANLPLLTQYDLNFTMLVRALNAWGQRLAELSFPDEAISVLSFAVSIGTDIKGSYQLLAKLYRERGEQEKIAGLKESASRLNSLMKEPILAMLDEA